MKKCHIICRSHRRAGELFNEYLRLIRHIPGVKANRRKLIVYIGDEMVYRFIGDPDPSYYQGLHADTIIYDNEFEEILGGIRRMLNDYRSDEGSNN